MRRINYGIEARKHFYYSDTELQELHANMNNSSNEAHLASEIARFAVPFVFLNIFIVGVIGNGTLVFTVFHNKVLHNAPNIHIVSLAIGDLLLIVITIPFTATIFTFESWPYGVVVCKLSEYLQTLSVGVSVFTLTALSADRYNAIVNPIKHVKKVSPVKFALIIASLIWIASALLALPDAILSSVEDMGGICICKKYTSTQPNWYPKVRVITDFTLYFSVPLLVVFVFYVLMARMLTTSARGLREGQGSSDRVNKQMDSRKKVAKLVLAFVLVFAVCWLPRHIYVFWYQFDEETMSVFWFFFKISSFCLAFINSCVNPISLYLLSKQFRSYYNRYLFCCCNSSAYRNHETLQMKCRTQIRPTTNSTTAFSLLQTTNVDK
ncbi:unnamed protein product [Dimorphilus gyrociliatus]|uniref:G-protein coupled receptors family 1 profile domain-containing protein n=1 Tax=Dimorphilus gyrociliatus TaxID=2664684 RepID=A0A7I8V642_9ANNE|nr:unnamed protein product [Dimorphilus gyrociliatus]